MESSNPNQNTSSPNKNFFFTPNTTKALPTQNKMPQEFLASYSPDFQYVEALLSSHSPDPKLIEKFMQGSPTKQLSPPKGLTPIYETPTKQNQQYSTNEYYEQPVYDEKAPFTNKFPRAGDYFNFQSLLETFPHLQGLNDPFFDIESVSPDAHFYIMRSSNDDNIHKAIKYHIWTTTASGKNMLSRAWREFQDKGINPEVYLIFSVVNSNQFLGVAKLASDILHNETFKYWWEPCKWFGVFNIKWLFVKDIHHAQFEHLKQEVYQHIDHNNIKTPTLCSVINLRDSTKINAKVGKQILSIFAKHPIKPNVFDSFAYMDRREDQLRVQRDSDPNFVKLFDEYLTAYQQHPETFRPQTGQPHYFKKDFKKNPQQQGSNEYYQNQHQHQYQHQQNNYYNAQKQYHHHQNKYNNQHQEGYEPGNYRGNRRGMRGTKPRGTRGYARGGGGRGPRFYANKGDNTPEGYNNNDWNEPWQGNTYNQYNQYGNNQGFPEGEKK